MSLRLPPPRLAIVLGLAILALAVMVPPQAQAQDPGYGFVDLAVWFHFPDNAPSNSPYFFVLVANEGNITARDVRVDLSYIGGAPAGPDRSEGLEREVYIIGNEYVQKGLGKFTTIDNTSGVWNIPSLEPGSGAILILLFIGAGQLDSLHKYDAEVSSSAFEPEARLGNNRDTGYIVGTPDPDGVSHSVACHWAVAAVDDPAPAPGDTVNVTITMTTDRCDLSDVSEDTGAFWAGCVNVGLTPGLTAGSPTSFSSFADQSFYDAEFSYDSGGHCRDRAPDTYLDWPYGESDFDVDGAFYVDYSHRDHEEYSVTLPVTVASNAAVNEQCVTVEMFALGERGIQDGGDYPYDNFDQVCLGAAPNDDVLVLTEGEIDLFTWYDCAEKTASPCNDDISVELVALGGDAAEEAGSPYSAFHPDNVVVHIQDPLARQTSSGSSAIVWSTGFGFNGDDDYPGVIMDYQRTLLDVETDIDPDRWGRPDVTYPTFQVFDLKAEIDGPGEFATWWDNSGTPAAFFNPGSEGVIFDSFSYMCCYFSFWAEFETLGTYRLKMTTDTVYDVDTTDSIAAIDVTEVETYTFHVGPMAELAVGDGGASAHARPDHRAITITAVNHGPDDALDAEVDIDLDLPDGVRVADHLASDGVYRNGKWDLGEFRHADYRRAQAKPAEATLTLFLDGPEAAQAAATATATIANVQDYSVCVNGDATTASATTETACNAISGATWHSGDVYDYQDNNDTVTAVSWRGEGGGPLRLRHPKTYERATVLKWDYPDKHLHGAPIVGFDVQWSNNGRDGWVQLESAFPRTRVVDLTNPTGRTRYYRVRPVSEAGQKGPWSALLLPLAGPLSFSVSSLTIAEGSSDSYQVSLETPPAGPVLVLIEESSGPIPHLEYDPPVLAFTPDDYNVPQTVTVTAPEGYARDVATTLEHAASGGGYDTVFDLPVTVLNVDGGSPGVIVSVPSLRLAENGGVATYNVALLTQPAADVHVVAQPGDKSLVLLEPVQLLFTPSNWSTPRTVTVTGVSDGVVNPGGSRTITVAHRAWSDDPDYDGIDVAPVELTVSDVGAAVGISKTSLTMAENGGAGTYTVALGWQPTDEVLVWTESGDSRVAMVTPQQLRFTTSNWSTPQTVTVVGVDDDEVNSGGSRTTAVSHFAASDDIDFFDIDIASVAVTVTDDDGVTTPVVPTPTPKPDPTPTPDPEDGANTESASVDISETGLSVGEDGGAATYTVVLGRRPTAEVSVWTESGDTGAAQVTPQRLRFTTSNWSTPQAVTVVGVDDGEVNPGGSRAVTVSHSATSEDGDFSDIDIASVAVTVTDNDGVSTPVVPDPEPTPDPTPTPDPKAALPGRTRLGVMNGRGLSEAI